MRKFFLALSIILATGAYGTEADPDEIVIIEGENRTVYEYRQNGLLIIIKVVPKTGRPYYMVPADGSPHYDDLANKGKLYPQWVIVDW